MSDVLLGRCTRFAESISISYLSGFLCVVDLLVSGKLNCVLVTNIREKTSTKVITSGLLFGSSRQFS